MPTQKCLSRKQQSQSGGTFYSRLVLRVTCIRCGAVAWSAAMTWKCSGDSSIIESEGEEATYNIETSQGLKNAIQDELYVKCGHKSIAMQKCNLKKNCKVYEKLKSSQPTRGRQHHAEMLRGFYATTSDEQQSIITGLTSASGSESTFC